MYEGELKYSIIYAEINTVSSERISVGILFSDGDNVEMRYSKKKISAITDLMEPSRHKYLKGTILSMSTRKKIKTESDINYLVRYSNNLITFSKLETVRLSPNDKNKDKLYKMFVYSN